MCGLDHGYVVCGLDQVCCLMCKTGMYSVWSKLVFGPNQESALNCQDHGYVVCV